MTRKQALALLCLLQAALIGLLFLPIAYAGPENGAWLSAIDLANRYADMGRSIDSRVYLFFALGCPLVSIPFMFLVRNQRTAVGTVACLSAMEMLVHACFYEAVKSSVAVSVTLGGRYFCIILIALISLLLSIYIYLFVAMDGKGKEEEKDKK